MPREPVIMVSNCAHLSLIIPNGQMCLECGDDFEESNHIRSITKCAKCKYQTACSRAILDHTTRCNFTVKSSEPPAPYPLDKEWFCICGYSSSEGIFLFSSSPTKKKIRFQTGNDKFRNIVFLMCRQCIGPPFINMRPKERIRKHRRSCNQYG